MGAQRLGDRQGGCRSRVFDRAHVPQRAGAVLGEGAAVEGHELFWLVAHLRHCSIIMVFCSSGARQCVPKMPSEMQGQRRPADAALGECFEPRTAGAFCPAFGVNSERKVTPGSDPSAACASLIDQARYASRAGRAPGRFRLASGKSGEVGSDVAITVIVPLAAERVIEIAPRQRLVFRQQSHGCQQIASRRLPCRPDFSRW